MQRDTEEDLEREIEIRLDGTEQLLRNIYDHCKRGINIPAVVVVVVVQEAKSKSSILVL